MFDKILILTTLMTMVLFQPTAFGSGSSGGGGGSGGAAGGGGGVAGAAGVNVTQQSQASSQKVRSAREALRKRMKQKRAYAAAAATQGQTNQLFDHTYRDFDNVLKSHVYFNENKTASTFDYKNFDPTTLKSFLNSSTNLTKTQFDKWTKNQQLAFLINLYNAHTVVRAMTKYPIKSFKELGSGFPFYISPWKVKFFTLFGEESHLDRIEHELVRGTDRYNDPRIHFAFNCASIGCPALLDEPFLADKIDEQLEGAMDRFLQDKTRNYYDSKKNTFYISKIFSWYESDFEKGHKGYNSLDDFLIQKAEVFTTDSESLAKIRKGNFDVDYLTYDWSLNDRSNEKNSRIR